MQSLSTDLDLRLCCSTLGACGLSQPSRRTSARRSWVTCCGAHIPSHRWDGMSRRVEKPSDSRFASEHRSAAAGASSSSSRGREKSTRISAVRSRWLSSIESLAVTGVIEGSQRHHLAAAFSVAITPTACRPHNGTARFRRRCGSTRACRRAISLVYLAGMGFNRTTFESESRFEILPAGITITCLGSLHVTKTVTLRRQTARGVRGSHRSERPRRPRARRATARARQSAWLLRPAVGLAWEF